MPESTAYTFRFTSAGQTYMWGCGSQNNFVGSYLEQTTDHLEFGLFLIVTEFFVCFPWVSQLGVRKLD